MYKQAAQLKLRFDSKVGQITAEDLFDLPLTSKNKACLDDIAKGLHREIKDGEEESFVVSKSRGNALLELKFNIVKSVIADKIEAAQAAQNKAETVAKRTKLMAKIAEKQDSALDEKSLEELQAELAATK